MAEIEKSKYTDLVTMMRKVISAHTAVREGIATHAEKERTKRQEAYHKLEADKRLQESQVASNAAIQGPAA